MDPQRKKDPNEYRPLAIDSEALLSLLMVILMVVVMECANV